MLQGFSPKIIIVSVNVHCYKCSVQSSRLDGQVMLFHVWLGCQPVNFKQYFLILVFGFGIDLLKSAGKTNKLWAFCHGCFRASHVFVFILSWFPQNLHIRFAESANYLASLDFSVVIIGIFLLDFSWNSLNVFCVFPYGIHWYLSP